LPYLIARKINFSSSLIDEYFAIFDRFAAKLRGQLKKAAVPP